MYRYLSSVRLTNRTYGEIMHQNYFQRSSISLEILTDSVENDQFYQFSRKLPKKLENGSFWQNLTEFQNENLQKFSSLSLLS